MKNLDAMTFDELRDHAAKLEGWTRHGVHWCKGDKQQRPHPIPRTLDAIAPLMPDGWGWIKDGIYWTAAQDGTRWILGIQVFDTGDEKRDRLLLACKCREYAACRAADVGG